MSKITAEALRNEVLRLADENPSFVYPVCDEDAEYTGVYNATEKQPSCIFGQALINLGEPVPLSWEGNGISVVLSGYYKMSTSDYREAFISTQSSQDSGVPWGNAVEFLRNGND